MKATLLYRYLAIIVAGLFVISAVAILVPEKTSLGPPVLQWTYDNPALQFISISAGDQGKAIYLRNDTSITAIKQDGSVAWTYADREHGPYVTEITVGKDNDLYFGIGSPPNVKNSAQIKSMICLLPSGEEKWSVELDSSRVFYNYIHFADGTTIVLANVSVAINPTGSIIWQKEIPGYSYDLGRDGKAYGRFNDSENIVIDSKGDVVYRVDKSPYVIGSFLEYSFYYNSLFVADKNGDSFFNVAHYYEAESVDRIVSLDWRGQERWHTPEFNSTDIGSIIPTDDGGAFVTRTQRVPDYSRGYVEVHYLTKLDTNGNEVWNISQAAWCIPTLDDDGDMAIYSIQTYLLAVDLNGASQWTEPMLQVFSVIPFQDSMIVLQEPEYGHGTVSLYNYQTKNVPIVIGTILLTAFIAGLGIAIVTWHYRKTGKG